uniref:Uncharacterized protein LOC114347356 n=1 Tax=Diabrotica virgifera virgifera TaxID=50390 RepID=A0A6P7GVU6_DIAVI
MMNLKSVFRYQVPFGHTHLPPKMEIYSTARFCHRYRKLQKHLLNPTAMLPPQTTIYHYYRQHQYCLHNLKKFAPSRNWKRALLTQVKTQCRARQRRVLCCYHHNRSSSKFPDQFYLCPVTTIRGMDFIRCY